MVCQPVSALRGGARADVLSDEDEVPAVQLDALDEPLVLVGAPAAGGRAVGLAVLVVVPHTLHCAVPAAQLLRQGLPIPLLHANMLDQGLPLEGAISKASTLFQDWAGLRKPGAAQQQGAVRATRFDHLRYTCAPPAW